ncbi:MAG: hypothetical protein ABMB14_05160 [Myxococcota bacterium]
MSWREYVRVREGVRLRALAAAHALRAGSIGEARRALADWTFGDDAALIDRVLERVAADPPAPSPAARAALLASAEAIGGWETTARLTPFRHFAASEERFPAGVAAPDDPIAWGLAALELVRREIERVERASWRRVYHAPDPAQDQLAHGWWSAWFRGDPWSIERSFQRQLGPIARSTARSIAKVRGLPRPVEVDLCERVDEAWFGWLLGPGRTEPDAVPGWAEVVARILESSPDGPATGLVDALPPGHRAAMAGCAVRRGYGSRTSGWLFPDTRRARHRALRFARLPIEVAFDLHVVGRLLEHWADGRTAPAVAWRVVEQNRGRGRARLRALVADAAVDPANGAMVERVLGLDALYARTVRGLRRYLRDRLWFEVGRDFSLGDRPAVDARCAPSADDEADPPELPDGPVRSWVLLVALKGRLDHLIRWARDGGTGDRDTRWGELLARDLPPELATNGGTRSYDTFRCALAEVLPEVLGAIRPQLEIAARLDPGSKRLGDEFRDRVCAEWHPSVPVPKIQYRRYVAYAVSALSRLDDLDALP